MSLSDSEWEWDGVNGWYINSEKNKSGQNKDSGKKVWSWDSVNGWVVCN